MTAGPTAPYRIRPSIVRDGLAGQCGAENGPVVYARLVLAAGTHAAVVAAACWAAQRRVPWLRRQAGRVLHHVLLLRCRIYFSMDDNEAPRAEV